jgi:hypothetical protein
MIKIVTLGIVFICVLTISSTCIGAEGYEILFKGTNSKLSTNEKQQIFDKLDFRLSENRKFLVDDTCGEDVSPMVEVVDLPALEKCRHRYEGGPGSSRF